MTEPGFYTLSADDQESVLAAAKRRYVADVGHAFGLFRDTFNLATGSFGRDPLKLAEQVFNFFCLNAPIVSTHQKVQLLMRILLSPFQPKQETFANHLWVAQRVLSYFAGWQAIDLLKLAGQSSSEPSAWTRSLLNGWSRDIEDRAELWLYTITGGTGNAIPVGWTAPDWVADCPTLGDRTTTDVRSSFRRWVAEAVATGVDSAIASTSNLYTQAAPLPDLRQSYTASHPEPQLTLLAEPAKGRAKNPFKEATDKNMRTAARAIWKKHPGYSVSAVAKSLKRSGDYEQAERTIRNKIAAVDPKRTRTAV